MHELAGVCESCVFLQEVGVCSACMCCNGLMGRRNAASHRNVGQPNARTRRDLSVNLCASGGVLRGRAMRIRVYVCVCAHECMVALPSAETSMLLPTLPPPLPPQVYTHTHTRKHTRAHPPFPLTRRCYCYDAKATTEDDQPFCWTQQDLRHELPKKQRRATAAVRDDASHREHARTSCPARRRRSPNRPKALLTGLTPRQTLVSAASSGKVPPLMAINILYMTAYASLTSALSLAGYGDLAKLRQMDEMPR